MKKVVGILSMQRVINYGSYLQAIGLKTTIESLGHQVKFVDIEPGEKIDFGYKVDKVGYQNLTGMKRLLAVTDRYILKRLTGKLYRKKLTQLFNHMHNTQLQLPTETNYAVKCDTLVVGSDEVFNCVMDSPWGLSMPLFGDYKHADRIISYAACCGFTERRMLPDNIALRISNSLKNMHSISVRDKNTFSFVESLVPDKKIYELLDPVLISDFTEIEKSCPQKKKYLLVYAYTNRINLKHEIDSIRKFAKQKGLKTLSIGGYQCWCDYNLIVEPLQVFDIFRQAEYVVTDTFHGSLIAAKMNCRFATIVRSSNNHKVEDLLDRLSLKDRIIDSMDKLPIVLDRKIDYGKTNNIISQERIKAIEYLRENL